MSRTPKLDMMRCGPVGKVYTYCTEFDDLVDGVLMQPPRPGADSIYLITFLEEWKRRVPNLKLTLFTVPTRTSDTTIRMFKLGFGDWIKLAPHGWAHSRGECLGWSKQEAVEKIQLATKRGIDAPIFRAPGWLLDVDTYEACRELGYVVASHKDHRIPNTGVREYVYNIHVGADPMSTKRIHGHLTPVSGNWIYDLHAQGRLNFRKEDMFVWPWEVATIINEGTI